MNRIPRTNSSTMGPWHLHTSASTPHSTINDEVNTPLAVVFDTHQVHGRANATLMTAAPEMYDALEETMDRLLATGFVVAANHHDLVMQIRNALMKARGEKEETGTVGETIPAWAPRDWSREG